MMKKLLSILSLSALSICSFAQKYYSSDPASAILFCGGFNSSNVFNDSVTSTSVKSLTGGLQYKYIISEKFNLNVGAMYTGKGYKRDKPFEKYRYYYIDLPLYLQYHIVPDVRLDLGAQYSVFSMGNKIVLNDSKSSGQDHQKVGAFRPSDHGLMAGINIRMHDNFDLSAHYYLSLSAFQKSSPGDFSVIDLQLQYYMLRFYSKGKKKDDIVK